MIQLTPEQREALAVLNEADAGIYESGSLEDRLTIGHRRTLDLCHRYATPYLRTLVVAPVANLEAWRREFRKREDHPSVFGSPKASPEVWETFLPNRQPGSWIISWESMRGFIAANQRTHPRKTSKKDVTRAMGRGTVPPWTGTGTWDLVIADDSQHMAFRNTLQRQVMQTIQSRHRLALSDNATGSHPEGLWGTLNWLWPDRYPNYWNWLNTCFNVDYIKNAKFTKTEILGEKMPGSSWLDVPCAVRKAP